MLHHLYLCKVHTFRCKHAYLFKRFMFLFGLKCFPFPQSALGMMQMVEDTLIEHAHTKPLLPSQLIRYREVQIPDGRSDTPNTDTLTHSQTHTPIEPSGSLYASHARPLGDHAEEPLPCARRHQ